MVVFITALSYFLISWSTVFLIDYLLRLKNFLPYIEFANRHGLEISPFQVRIYTARNYDGEEEIRPLSKRTRPFLRVLASLWFSIGALVSIICLFGITIYLTQMIVKDVSLLSSFRPSHSRPYRSIPEPSTPSSSQPSSVVDDLPVASVVDYDILEGGQRRESGLVPIIPGYNLPWNHLPIFMIVLIIAAVFHELGHSIAATTHDVRVNGFGIFLFALYPGAFTDIEQESLKRSSHSHRLMIYGGGIWHNVVLAGFAYLLFMSTPILLSPFYSQGQGVVVMNVDERSGLYGSAGLLPGSIVIEIDDCSINIISDWRNCVRQLEQRTTGRCVANSRIQATKATKVSLTEDEVHCCDDFHNITHAHMCFESNALSVTRELATAAPSLNRILKLGTVEKPAEVVREKREVSSILSCMSARYVTDQPICNTTNKCKQDKKDDEKVCIYPALYNGTQLARITVQGAERPVLYVGNLDELISFVSIHALIPRFDIIPYWMAESIELIPKYLFTLSLALALLNAVPCYALDGQYIVHTLIAYIFSYLSKRRRHQLVSLILFFGSLLLAANILFGFINFILVAS